MAGEIVLGYDDSDGARAALPVAVEMARAFGVPLLVAFGYAPTPMGGEVKDLAETVRALGERLAGEGAGRARALAPDLVVETVLVDDRPAQSLIDVAEQRGARMIVVGTHGEGPIKGAILGSVPHKLVHRSTVPVMVVPVPEQLSSVRDVLGALVP